MNKPHVDDKAIKRLVKLFGLTYDQAKLLYRVYPFSGTDKEAVDSVYDFYSDKELSGIKKDVISKSLKSLHNFYNPTPNKGNNQFLF